MGLNFSYAVEAIEIMDIVKNAISFIFIYYIIKLTFFNDIQNYLVVLTILPLAPLLIIKPLPPISGFWPFSNLIYAYLGCTVIIAFPSSFLFAIDIAFS